MELGTQIDSICETLENITPPDIAKLEIDQGSNEEDVRDNEEIKNEEIGEETEVKDMKKVEDNYTEDSDGSVESESESKPACPHSGQFVNDL